MKSLTHWKSCVAIATIVLNISASDLKGHSAATFELTPTTTPGQFADTVKGLAQLKGLENWSFEANQTVLLPATPEAPMLVKGIWIFTSADGSSTLVAENEGYGLPDPANSAFINLKYRLRFVSGTGKMKGVRGNAELEGLATLTSFTTGIASLTIKGQWNAAHSRNENR